MKNYDGDWIEGDDLIATEARLMNNVWYSVNINGVRHGFFKSNRGIKQGDPLSLSVFIIGTELLSRLTNSLMNTNFVPYFTERNGPKINHLCYTDDTILFSFCDPTSLELLMSKLNQYEQVSGQLVNKYKSGFYVPFKDDDPRINEIKRITGFSHCPFTMTYLGCPIYFGRKRVISNRLQGWQCKFLSYGGKAVLIKSVLYVMPLHLLAVIQPTKTTLDQIDKIVANFFWARSKQEQEDFLLVKYCKRSHPVAQKWGNGQSNVWRRLMDIKSKVEPHIFWKIGKGDVSFWWDNWSRLGAIASIFQLGRASKITKVNEFMNGGLWNLDKLLQVLPLDMVHTIKKELDIDVNKADHPYWLLEDKGNFTCKSA
ncbi:uncharacterized protein LOC132614994 [Lycium barbarum]|uniref:uncharacterized protein LOC132614994 n=1 Tax=Lycium barbarum TaxID=112863 RepID=UPI00293E2F0E|nr:uncharacterized protein LOC132614994 [Lycium barbarum]